uniref:Uncharacterized protein n=1 Tax=Amphimedon queenslandica TaxID=400682 RepID=A0A1X7VDI7_AMPQE
MDNYLANAFFNFVTQYNIKKELLLESLRLCRLELSSLIIIPSLKFVILKPEQYYFIEFCKFTFSFGCHFCTHISQTIPQFSCEKEAIYGLCEHHRGPAPPPPPPVDGGPQPPSGPPPQDDAGPPRPPPPPPIPPPPVVAGSPPLVAGGPPPVAGCLPLLAGGPLTVAGCPPLLARGPPPVAAGPLPLPPAAPGLHPVGDDAALERHKQIVIWQPRQLNRQIVVL